MTSDTTITGHVYWITGLSGAGKSTMARELVKRLREENRAVILLDGDDLRGVYGDGLAFTLPDRRTLALRHARLCQLLAMQGFDVVCATISLFHDCHRWCRDNLPNYHEIYLRVALEELRRRDPRGLYQRVATGEQRDLMGIDLPVEEPLTPDLLIENDGGLSVEDTMEQVWQYVTQAKGRGDRAG